MGSIPIHPVASLLDFLPGLLQRSEYATHGVAESSKEGGVVRFYKAVNVQEVEGGQVCLAHVACVPCTCGMRRRAVMGNSSQCRNSSFAPYVRRAATR